MAKQIKFPLVMKNGVQVRDIETLRENFDIVSAIEYFTTGKLERWLESNYYDDILEKIQRLTGSEEDFAKVLAEALGAELKDGSFDSTDIIRQTKLKEELKRYIEEKELEDMEYIAESQKNLEMLVDAGHKKIYLYGDEFTILKQMENVECIGINAPIISVQAESREEFRNQNIKLKGVKFVNTETKKIAMDEPIIDEYYTVLDVLTSYIGKVKKEMRGSRHGKDYI